MAQALEPLEDKSRSKRQTEDEGQSADETADDDPFKNSQLEIDSLTKTIQMPLGRNAKSIFYSIKSYTNSYY